MLQNVKDVLLDVLGNGRCVVMSNSKTEIA